ncbi:DUF1566 domain-containing protein [Bacteroides fragilis]|uniref:Putative lipoprotein n=1 Tax=Bacteroides fragilis str. 2-F-2 \|nr:DUF1566 domain-containing protein [Bacteroides fragilis]EXY16978.1 putative lipoprotein [Bacteroides fragilis str. 2-F-2 \
MKNKPILKLNRLAMIIPAVLVLLSLSSCQQEEPYSNRTPPGSTLVNLSVSASNSDVTLVSDDPASAIKSLCILQFNANGNDFGTLRHVGIGTENVAGGGKYSATLLQSVDTNDKYKFVVLANFPNGYGVFQGMTGKSYAAVQQACLSEEVSGNLGFDTNNCFPMFGIPKDGTPEVIDETLDLGSVSLVRAVARVDIGIGKKDANTNTWSKNGVKFNMTQIQIWKSGKQYAYMPLEGSFSSAGGALTITAPSPVGAVATKAYDNTYITSGTYCAEKIYLPEADLQWGSVYDTKHTSRLAIIVGGKYNGSQKETFYRVDLTNDQTSETMNILRNHIYQLTIKSVMDDGYDTAELAYQSIPKNIGFTTELAAWTFSPAVSVPSSVRYHIAYGKINGEELVWSTTSNPQLVIPPKKKMGWGTNKNLRFDYNGFYGEANSYYADVPPIERKNGRLYPTVENAFSYEGAYPSLMISADDIIDLQGNEAVPWKTGKATLTAFDLCRSYQGDGYSDWRLPRLSELALIYLNKDKLENMRGFSPLSGTYWSGSEYQVSTSKEDLKHSERAWAINFDVANPNNAANHAKTETLKIRCVRQAQ